MHTRHPLRWYFGLAFAISWSAALLAATQDRLYLLFVGMLLGPTIASVGLTAAVDGTHGLRTLGRALRRVRVGRWYLALLIAPALLAVVLAVLSAFSPAFVPDLLGRRPSSEVLVYALIAGFGAGIFEELGWTGFATPRLLRRHGWLQAGLLLGVPWAIWHALPDFLGRASHGGVWVVHMAEWLVALAAFRVVMTWVYSRTRSLALGMLMHVSFTGSQALLWPGAATPAQELIWYGVFAVALWLVVGAVVRASTIAPSLTEESRWMPGDAIVRDPMISITHAITIDAPPDDIWPWLAQMGAQRAGWYSYDLIDNGGARSADDLLPAFQDVGLGDVMPALPGAHDAFVVTSLDPPRDLIVTVPGDPGPIVSWEHLIEPVDANRSRLIVRSRVARGWKRMARGAGRPGQRLAPIERIYRVIGRLPDRWMIAAGGLGHRWMEVRHLRGIKRRAEASA